MLPCALARRCGKLLVRREGSAVGFDIFLRRRCLAGPAVPRRGKALRCCGCKGDAELECCVASCRLTRARARTHTHGRWQNPTLWLDETTTSTDTHQHHLPNPSYLIHEHICNSSTAPPSTRTPLLHVPSDPSPFPISPPRRPIRTSAPPRAPRCFNPPPTLPFPPSQRANHKDSLTQHHLISHTSSLAQTPQVTPRHSACQPSVARSIHHHHPNEIGTGSMAPSPSLFFFLSPGLNKKSDESGDLFSRGWGAWV